MDIWEELKKLAGYNSGDGGVDSYGVDHSGFSTRDELEYQNARLTRENQLAENFAKQGIAEENYPKYGTNFWGQTSENNYGFGTSNISQNVQDVTNRLNSMATQNNNTQQLQMPAGSEQQLTMPSYELQQPQTSTWDKIKNAANNFADATQAATVGYATGASLGNFDEAMGTATAAVTGNPNNYTLGRDATRQLQNNLQKQHPYVYGGAEFAGAMTTPMHLAKDTTFANKALNAFTDTLNASAGYAQNWKDFGTNLAVNGIANIVGLKAEQLPIWRATGNTLSKFATNTGRKFIKQGINSSADKLKNVYYKEDDEDEEEKYYYW